ncbi:hypothetical protein GCM10023201_49330 [Actinomycetospora corticicola]|uniref:LPXTG cell wall anchor domain-containing protein n=1 Tax=Actinomycetospora corticicola TaxID=663602 RepID=A0A7Y9DYB6_9PSEU|nr:hypothetical protein [Actinomycetospora corticicola]NYD37798.1 hypothetical protein [Actinomycetospora corticicola]
MSAHRRTRRARPVVGRVALVGVALAGLSAAPGATVAVSTPLEIAPTASPVTSADHDDVLWYGLLSAAALAGAAGAHQLVGRPRRA